MFRFRAENAVPPLVADGVYRRLRSGGLRRLGFASLRGKYVPVGPLSYRGISVEQPERIFEDPCARTVLSVPVAVPVGVRRWEAPWPGFPVTVGSMPLVGGLPEPHAVRYGMGTGGERAAGSHPLHYHR